MEASVSRTRKKRAAQDLQKLGERLIALSDEQLNALDLPEELSEAVAAARLMKSHGARRRQRQYIGVLMRQADMDRIRDRLEALERQASDDARRFKQVEMWRDRLRTGDTQLFETLLMQYRQIDRNEFNRLVTAASKNQSQPSHRKAGRALFRYLRRLVD